jgi:FSR family fosmidomycin resistance protein-like MFS transporter
MPMGREELPQPAPRPLIWKNINMTIATRTGTHLSVLIVLGLTHLLNDMMQSLIPAAYPILKEAYTLDFVQIGMITMTF